MKDRHEKRTEWVERGRYVVAVDVEVVYPFDDPAEACLEPATVKLLDEVAKRAEAGDLKFLRKVGRVFERVSA